MLKPSVIAFTALTKHFFQYLEHFQTIAEDWTAFCKQLYFYPGFVMIPAFLVGLK
jgi:hypothetical protein